MENQIIAEQNTKEQTAAQQNEIPQSTARQTGDAQIIIDEEFKYLMPPLGKEAYASLEAGIIKDGCINPVILWDNTLIDGHNRYAICTEHDIAFETVNMSFGSREEAKLWIIEMQAGRRNLTPNQLFYYRGLHYRTAKKVAGTTNTRLENGRWSQNETNGQSGRTSYEFAQKYKVSRGTIMRDAKASEGVDAIGEISQEAKQKVLTHEVIIGKNALEKLAAAPEEEVKVIAQSIEAGTFDKANLTGGLHITGPEITSPETAASPVANPFTETGGITSSEGNAWQEGTAPAGDDLTKMITGSFIDLLDILRTGTSAQKKRSIRECINTLEEMYTKLTAS